MIKLKLPTAAYFRKIMKKEKKKKQHSFQILLKLNDSVCHSRGTKKKKEEEKKNTTIVVKVEPGKEKFISTQSEEDENKWKWKESRKKWPSLCS